jgi:hypothetical protein
MRINPAEINRRTRDINGADLADATSAHPLHGWGSRGIQLHKADVVST